MDAILEVVSGAKPAKIRLRLPTIIGRSDEAEVKVRNSLVSRKHCEIYVYEGELAVCDLGSANGTVINGEQIEEPTILAPGDELTIGPVTLKAVYQVGQTDETSTESSDQEAVEQAQRTPIEESSTADAMDDDSEDDGAMLDEASRSSIVRYSENEGGSFIGIEELDLPAVSEDDHKVDTDDRALNDFFKSLE